MTWWPFLVIRPILYASITLNPFVLSKNVENYFEFEEKDTITLGLLIDNLQNGHEAISIAQLAINQANRNQKINNKIFRLEYRVTDGLWGQASNMAVELIYEEKAVAIVGALDGRTSHLAEQVTAKSHVPYIETYASDPTLSKAFVPWFFQIIPNDYQVSKTFIKDIYNKHNLSKVAIISDNTYDGNIASSTFKKTISEENVNNPTYFFLSDRDSELIDTISRLRKDKFEAIVFLTNTANLYSEMSSFLNKTSARIYHIRYIEKKKKSLPSYSYHTILAIADSAKYNRFKEQFLKSDNKNPSIKSVYTYDAINLLIESVSAIGTDPISIGKTISEMEGYKGISGQINFNERGQLKRKVELSLIK